MPQQLQTYSTICGVAMCSDSALVVRERHLLKLSGYTIEREGACLLPALSRARYICKVTNVLREDIF